MNNNPCQKLGIDKPINAIIINVISSQLFRFIALIIPIGIAIINATISANTATIIVIGILSPTALVTTSFPL